MKPQLLLMFLFFCSEVIANQKAFCSMPVADLVNAPILQKKATNPIQSYEQIPFSDKSGDFICPRLSQLIFNEPVEILETLGKEAKIKIFHWYHQSANSDKKHTIYWVKKEALTPLEKLLPEDRTKLPQPLSFEKKNSFKENELILRHPFKNKKTGNFYSAGTRFVKATKKQNLSVIPVYAYNQKNKAMEVIEIPKKYCVTQVPHTKKEKRKLFVSILKEWAHCSIAYVLGGASIGNPYEYDIIKEKQLKSHGKTAVVYTRPCLQKGPANGIDCAHTIARAAQIAGIDYFVKNTTAQKKQLSCLQKKQPLENGDILLWKGHTAVITDVKKGLLVEARSYEHGYGKLHEIPFAEQFENISTTEQLKTAYFNHQQIGRLNKKGEKVQTIYDLTIMKLPVT